MCWGIDTGDGWYDLIDTLCANVQHHVDWLVKKQQFAIDRGEIKPEDVVLEEDMQVVASQVKEKFGGLRFYVNAADDTVRGMIDMAESMSYKICETCGNPGRPNKAGWIVTLCPTCRAEMEKKRAEREQL